MNTAVGIETVARWFLSQEAMSGVRMQRLCYYAQCWHLALSGGRKLFPEMFQAWIYGPVCPKLYKTYSSWSGKIYEKCEKPVLPAETEAFLKRVWDAYGSLSEEDLNRLVESEFPWFNARMGVSPADACTREISIPDILSFYIPED